MTPHTNALALGLVLVGCSPGPEAERTVDPLPATGAVDTDAGAGGRAVGALPRRTDTILDLHAADTAGPVDTGLAGVPPDCEVVQPAADAVVPAGSPIRFEARVDDLDGDVVSIVWSSDVWGPMVVGASFDFELPAADHQVRLQVDDAAGNRCTRAIALHVR